MFKDGISIVKFTENNFPDNVLQIVDPQLLQELDLSMETPMAIRDSEAQILQSVINIGLCCTKTSACRKWLPSCTGSGMHILAETEGRSQ